MSDEPVVNPFQAPASEPALSAAMGEPTLSAAEFDRVLELLSRTRPWARTMAVLFWLCSLPLLIRIVRDLAPLAQGRLQTPQKQGEAVGQAIADFIMFAILFFPARSLWSYASHIGRFVRSKRRASLEEALDAQRRFWKLTTILSCILLALAVLGLWAVQRRS